MAVCNRHTENRANDVNRCVLWHAHTHTDADNQSDTHGQVLRRAVESSSKVPSSSVEKCERGGEWLRQRRAHKLHVGTIGVEVASRLEKCSGEWDGIDRARWKVELERERRRTEIIK